LLQFARQHKITLYLFYAAIAVDLLGLGYIGYLAFWPVKTIEVIGNDKILNPNKQVRIGDALIYQITYCKYTKAEAHIHRTLAGQITYPLPDSTNNIQPGCRTAISRNTIIPEGISPGRYRLELTATYHVNPLRAIDVSHHSESFDILPKATSDTTSSSVSGSSGLGGTSVVSGIPAPSPLPYGTDPLSQEPTQPAPAVTPPSPTPPTQSPQPSLISQVIQSIKGVIGL
jgi:hypothetical protein